MTIKLWDWEKGWKNVRVFEGNSRMWTEPFSEERSLHSVQTMSCRLRSTPRIPTPSPLRVWTGQVRSQAAAVDAASLTPSSQDLELGLFDAKFPARGARDQGCEPRRLLSPQRQALPPYDIRRRKQYLGSRPRLKLTRVQRTVKIWDYTTKSLIATLEGHTNNVSFACYHPELPIIISGSEDVCASRAPWLRGPSLT